MFVGHWGIYTPRFGGWGHVCVVDVLGQFSLGIYKNTGSRPSVTVRYPVSERNPVWRNVGAAATVATGLTWAHNRCRRSTVLSNGNPGRGSDRWQLVLRSWPGRKRASWHSASKPEGQWRRAAFRAGGSWSGMRWVGSRGNVPGRLWPPNGPQYRPG